MRKFVFILLLCFVQMASAQCTYKNTAVKSGETISYNLYYNWQFIWVKAGTASMSTTETTYKGHKSLRTSLITRGNGRLDNYFILRDTLVGYTTLDMAPLYYRKGAHEGKWYTVDEAFYSYPDGNCQVKLHRQHNDGHHSWDTKTMESCVFDMVNLFQRARSFNPSSWTKGYEIHFNLTDGVKIQKAKLRFGGKETVKADNKKKYDCLKLSYIELEGKKEHEIARFYVTNDERHIPVRLDMFLKFGSAKAFLTDVKY